MNLSVKNILIQRALLLNIRWEATYLDHWQANIRYTYNSVYAGSNNSSKFLLPDVALCLQ